MMSEKVEFCERGKCPACNETVFETVWAGNFEDRNVQEYIEEFHYSTDPIPLLKDQEFELVQCSACDLMYHRFVATDSSLPLIYNKWTDDSQVQRFESAQGRADPYKTAIGRLKLLLRLRILLESRFAEPYRLLDFGCGGGHDIAQANMLGFDAKGIDFSLSRMEHAKRFDCQVFADLSTFDSQVDEKVHAIILNQVLEHLKEPVEVLSALRERLLPGGVLYVAVPNCSNITVPRNFTEFHKVQPIEHVNAFTTKTLTSTVQKAGYSKASRPSVFVSTGLKGVARTVAGMVHLPESTEQFFRSQYPASSSP